MLLPATELEIIKHVSKCQARLTLSNINVRRLSHRNKLIPHTDAQAAPQTRIKLEWKFGLGATDWSEVAKKENLDVMATELRKLEQMVKDIHQEMLFLKKTEEEMRNLNGTKCPTGWEISW